MQTHCLFCFFSKMCLNTSPMKKVLIILAVVLALFAAAPLHAQNPTPTAQSSARLRIGTIRFAPFVMEKDGALTGFSIELWDTLAQDLRFNFEWVEFETIDALLNAVEAGEVDAAISAISMTPERETRIDFSHPHFQAGLQIVVPKQEHGDLQALAKTIFSPLLFQILAIGLLVTVVIAHIIWLVERDSNPDIPREYLRGVWEAVWWAVLTLTSATYGSGTPSSTLKRVLAIFWIVLGVLLVAQFTASMASLLTVQQLTSEIEGPSDLPGKAIGTIRGSTAARYLDEESIAFTEANTLDELYDLLRAGKIQAIVFDAPILQYFVHTRGKGTFDVVGPIFRPEEYGIALPIGSPLRESINTELLALRQDGRYETLVEKWFGEPQ